MLIQENQKQILAYFEIYKDQKLVEPSRPFLIWAGDLDRDQKLDLLVDVARHYNNFYAKLFLSTYTQVDDQQAILLKNVVSYSSVGH